MNNIDEKLNEVRQDIDKIDSQIQELVVTRAEKVKEVFNLKQQESNTLFYRPEREAKVLKKIMSNNCGSLPPKEMAKIFREIMSACLALQKPMNIAFLGPEGTFSQVAARKHFGSSLIETKTENIPDIFEKVITGQASYGVVPIENSITGLVDVSLNEFIGSPLTICGEVSIRINQCLLRNESFIDEPIHRIYAHQQSLLQCHQWLTKNYPEAELIAVNSNALAAQLTEKEKNAAAIAGEQCVDLYDLNAVTKNIADHLNNFTRFLIIGHQQPEASGDDRTSLLIKVHDAPGTLEKLINPLAKNAINITMIRSKPADLDQSIYYFFLDLDCYCEDANFLKAKEAFESNMMEVKVLGSYPKAVL